MSKKLALLTMFLLFLIINSFAFAECDESKKRDFKRSNIDLLYGDMAAVIKLSVKQAIDEYKENTKHDPTEKTVYFLAEIDGKKQPLVFGMSEKQVLEMDGDPNGAACNHDHNDMSNRWCHSYFVKLAYETAKSAGIPNFISAMMGASIFVVKEYAIDLHPSKPDLVIADYTLFKSKNKNEIVSGTIFGDGMIFITYQKKF